MIDFGPFLPSAFVLAALARRIQGLGNPEQVWHTVVFSQTLLGVPRFAHFGPSFVAMTPGLVIAATSSRVVAQVPDVSLTSAKPTSLPGALSASSAVEQPPGSPDNTKDAQPHESPASPPADHDNDGDDGLCFAVTQPNEDVAGNSD